MGGNAIKTVPTVRLEVNDYNIVVNDILSNLKAILPDREIEDIKSYKLKQSFGYLDILISGNTIGNPKQFLKDNFNCEHFVKNSNIISFAYYYKTLDCYFQIDLIFVNLNIFNFALNYFAYNDLGNLIGRIASSNSMSFGWDGLHYKLYHDGQFVKKIPITKCFKTAVEILGFDYQLFQNGFSTLEDIFEFVIRSKYFSVESYIFANRNSEDRKRDTKRKTYVSFIDYLERNSINSVNEKIDLSLVIDSLKLEIKEIINSMERSKQVSQKYNGHDYSRVTGFSGKNLGIFISVFKDSFKSEQEYQQFILQTEREIIDSMITSFYVEYTKNVCSFLTTFPYCKKT